MALPERLRLHLPRRSVPLFSLQGRFQLRGLLRVGLGKDGARPPAGLLHELHVEEDALDQHRAVSARTVELEAQGQQGDVGALVEKLRAEVAEASFRRSR